jgi:signal transduction histidine kinase
MYAFRTKDAYDPLVLRLIPVSVFFFTFAGSYFFDRLRDKIETFLQIGIFTTSCWLALLIHHNEFANEFVSAYSLIAFASVLVFQTRVRILIYSILSFAMLLIASIGVEGVGFNIPTAIGLNLGVLFASNLAIHYRLMGQTRLLQGLDESEVIQNVALESSRDAMLLVNEKGELKKGNAAFRELWEVPVRWIIENRQEEVMLHCMDRVVDPESLRDFVISGEKSLAESEVAEVPRLDGRTLELYWMRLKVQNQDIGRLWIFRDISARKKLEADLIVSERRLRHNNERLMEFAGSSALMNGDLDTAFSDIARVSAEILGVETVSIWIFEQEYATMVCRKLYRRSTDAYESGVRVPLNEHSGYLKALEQNRALIVGDTREDPMTESFYEGTYTGRATALIHAQIRSGGKMVGIISVESSDGPRVWSVEDQSYTYSMTDLVTVSLEANERRKAQLQLENSIAVLQAIFDLSETGIIVEDNENNVLHFNELYLKIWSMTREYVENAPYEEQIEYCKSQTINESSYADGLARLRSRPEMEYAGIIEFKNDKFVERYSKAINLGGKIKGRVWFYLDITDRKRKETELINRNFELDSFVYRASHDLKAPLNSIMGLISIIQEEKEVDTILGFISMMDKSVKKLDEFIKQLTQFSQDARLKSVRQPIAFEEFVEDVLRDLRFMESAARMDIRVKVDQQGEFHSDPIRLGIVFNNLISNAIKYQDTKKPLPSLEVNIVANGKAAVCQFSDNGLGIDQEHLEKIFDLFFRASVQASGSGLGLYITHNAIQKLEGKVTVESELGVGTTFTLTIPNQVEEAE